MSRLKRALQCRGLMHPRIPWWESGLLHSLIWPAPRKKPFFCLPCESRLSSATHCSNCSFWWIKMTFTWINFPLQQSEWDRYASFCQPEFISGQRRSSQCVGVRVQLSVPVLQCEGEALEPGRSSTTGGQHTPHSAMSHPAPHRVWGQFVCSSRGCCFATTCTWEHRGLQQM